MARKKRGSAVLEAARQRLAGIKSITPPPNLGPNLNLDNYEQDILNFTGNLAQYNEKLSALDTVQNNLDAEELQLRDKNKRFLAAVAAQYGTNSNEYEAAGGTRDDERDPRTRKPSGGDDGSTPQS